MSGPGGSIGRRWTLVLIATAAVAAACKPGPQPPSDGTGRTVGPTDTPTAAPTWGANFAARTTDSARYALLRDSLRQYARTLAYDGVDGSGDEQRVMIGSFPGGHYGPRLRIEPARGTHRLTDADFNVGRVIARIVAVSRDSAYPKFGITQPASDTLLYWYVFRVGGAWRGVIMSERGTGIAVPVDTTVHGPGKWKQEIARFVWEETDDGLWSDCTSMRCCRITSPQFAQSVPL